MKVIIAGGRDFTNYELLKQTVDSVLSRTTVTQIVSGGARGADKLGERYAKEKGYDLKIFPADWTKYGKAAGPIRNMEMAKYADALIAFWDGKSAGAQNVIALAKENKLQVRVKTIKNL